jgi:hypothetical protein
MGCGREENGVDPSANLRGKGVSYVDNAMWWFGFFIFWGKESHRKYLRGRARNFLYCQY